MSNNTEQNKPLTLDECKNKVVNQKRKGYEYFEDYYWQHGTKEIMEVVEEAAEMYAAQFYHDKCYKCGIEISLNTPSAINESIEQATSKSMDVEGMAIGYAIEKGPGEKPETFTTEQVSAMNGFVDGAEWVLIQPHPQDSSSKEEKQVLPSSGEIPKIELGKHTTREQGYELLKSIGYETNEITSTELWIARALSDKYKISHVEVEVEACECGHTVPLEFSVSDEEGNSTCMPCHLEFLSDEEYRSTVKNLPYPPAPPVSESLEPNELIFHQSNPHHQGEIKWTQNELELEQVVKRVTEIVLSAPSRIDAYEKLRPYLSEWQSTQQQKPLVVLPTPASESMDFEKVETKSLDEYKDEVARQYHSVKEKRNYKNWDDMEQLNEVSYPSHLHDRLVKAVALYEKQFQRNQHPIAINWLSDEEINKMFIPINQHGNRIACARRDGAKRMRDEIRSRLSAANGVDPVHFAEWFFEVAREYQRGGTYVADRPFGKQDTYKAKALFEIYLTEQSQQQNKGTK